MKRILIVIVISGIGNMLLGQTPSDKVWITMGKEEKQSKLYGLADIIGFDESGIYALKTKDQGMFRSIYYLAKYDNQMNPVQTEKIERPRKKQFLEYFTNLNNELQVFSSYSDKENYLNSYFIDNIDKSTLKFSGNEKTLAEIDFKGERRKNDGNFRMRISPDSSKILLFLDKPYHKRENESFDLILYDKDYNKMWENQITLPYPDGMFAINRIRVDNSGNVHIVGKEFKEKQEIEKGRASYVYHVLSYFNKGKNLKDLEIKLGDKFISDLQIALTDNDELLCAGFYSEYRTGIKGSYFIKFNLENQNVITNAYDEFTTDFITQNLSERKEEKIRNKEKKGKAPSLFRYKLDEIVYDDQGGAFLIGEQFYVKEVQRTFRQNGVNTTTTTYTYYYNDIIVIRMNPDGSIAWSKKIPKKQRSTNDGGFFLSYIMGVVDDKLYFVFNDNPKNLFVDEESSNIASFIGQKESIVTMVEMDSQGNQTREALFNTRDAEILVRPKVSEQISERKLVLYGQKKKTHKFVLLEFK